MIIYLLRHGPAQDASQHEGGDGSRPLTREGKEEVRQVARALPRLKVRPSLILTSPLIRARETAQIVARQLALAEEGVVETDQLKPGAHYGGLVRELRPLQKKHESVMLVGHEPDLSEFASLLISGSVEPVLTFKKTGIAAIECANIKPGRCGVLRWLLRPGQIVN